MSIEIRKAIKADITAVHSLLREARLPTEDIDPVLTGFFVTVDKEKIIGSIGLDINNDIGLLRSMAVNPAYRNNGIATALVDQILLYAVQNHISNIYLITDTAADFFTKRGFAVIEKNTAPREIRSSPQFISLCPSTARVMAKIVLMNSW